MQVTCREDTTNLPKNTGDAKWFAAGVQTFSYWMQGMHCGFCGTALFSFHPAVSCCEFASGRLCHKHLVSSRLMTLGTGCKGCQEDASLHPQL